MHGIHPVPEFKTAANATYQFFFKFEFYSKTCHFIEQKHIIIKNNRQIKIVSLNLLNHYDIICPDILPAGSCTEKEKRKISALLLKISVLNYKTKPFHTNYLHDGRRLNENHKIYYTY